MLPSGSRIAGPTPATPDASDAVPAHQVPGPAGTVGSIRQPVATEAERLARTGGMSGAPAIAALVLGAGGAALLGLRRHLLSTG